MNSIWEAAKPFGMMGMHHAFVSVVNQTGRGRIIARVDTNVEHDPDGTQCQLNAELMAAAPALRQLLWDTVRNAECTGATARMTAQALRHWMSKTGGGLLPQYTCETCETQFRDIPPLFGSHRHCEVQGCSGVALSDDPSAIGGIEPLEGANG